MLVAAADDDAEAEAGTMLGVADSVWDVDVVNDAVSAAIPARRRQAKKEMSRPEWRCLCPKVYFFRLLGAVRCCPKKKV